MFSRRWLAVFFLGAVALSFLLYGNTFKNQFVWDDVFFLNRPELSEPGHLGKLWLEPVTNTAAGLYRPLTVFTWSLNLIFGGKNPFGFHLVSIALNAAAIFLVLVLVARLFHSKILAVFSALFFAFLPIHTEAVALMKARDELLGTVFFMLSWLMFLRASKETKRLDRKRLAGSAALFFLAMLSKEFTVVAPAVFFAVYYLQNSALSGKEFLKRCGWGALFYGSFFVVYYLMRRVALPGMAFGNDDISPVSNILVVAPWWPGGFFTPFRILFLYISKIFVPINLSATYHFRAVTLVLNPLYSWRAISGFVFLVILVILIIWRRTRATPWGIGALAFLLLYLPVSQVFFRGGDIMAERWMYLPSVGMAMIAGAVFALLFQKSRKAAIIFFIIALSFYTAVIITRNRVWFDAKSLFESMVRDSPNSVKGYSVLAQTYLERGDIPKAAELIEKGLSISNQEPNLYVLEALIYYKAKKYDQAEQSLLKALSRDTFSAAAVLNFARVQFHQGKYAEAFWVLDRAIAEFPPSSIGFPEKTLYASILYKLGQYEDSIKYIMASMPDRLNDKDVKKLLAMNYYRLGKTAEALQYLDDSEARTEAEKIKLLEEY